MPGTHRKERFPLPLLANGNVHEHFYMYEATSHAHDTQNDVSKMTEFISKSIDWVAADEIAIVQHTLCEFTDIEGK